MLIKNQFFFLKTIELPIEIYGIYYIQQPRAYTVLNLGCSNFRTQGRNKDGKEGICEGDELASTTCCPESTQKMQAFTHTHGRQREKRAEHVAGTLQLLLLVVL